MSETAAAPAPEPQKQPTHEEIVALIRLNQQRDFDRHDHAERLLKAQRKSKCGHAGNNPLFGMTFDDPSIEFSLDELKALIPLDRDRLDYGWVNEDKGTHGVFAENRHGLFSIPKPGRVRRNMHMTKKQQHVKSLSLVIFRQLFEKQSREFEATCKEQNIKYIGLPEEALTELGAKAAQLALAEFKATKKNATRRLRRAQQFQRAVQAGTLTRISEKRYINRGGQFGA